MENQPQNSNTNQNFTPSSSESQSILSKPNKKFLITAISVFFVLLLVTIGAGTYFLWQRTLIVQPKPCPADAKICPNGMSLGRIWPSCEFPECPSDNGKHITIEECNNVSGVGVQTDSGNTSCPGGRINYGTIVDLSYDSLCCGPDLSTWQTYRNEEYGFEFKYPNDWVLNINNYRIYDPQKFSLKQCEEIENQCYYAVSFVVTSKSTDGTSLLQDFIDKQTNKPRITVSGNPNRIYDFQAKEKLQGIEGYKLSYVSSDKKVFEDAWIDLAEGRMLNLNFEYFGEKKYEEIFNQILSTFIFIN